MDSLAQSLVWLAWESYPAADSSLAAPPPQAGGQSSLPAPVAGPAVAIMAGALILGSSLGSPAWANNYRWGQTIYANPREGYALNVRWGPGTNTGINRCVRRGTPLEVSGLSRNGWVQLVDGTWVAGNLVRSSPAGPTTPPGTAIPPDCRFGPTTSAETNLATVVTPQNFALNIRNGPGVNYRIVGQFLNGSRIPLTGRFNGIWAQLPNGTWVDSTHLQYRGGVQIPTQLPAPINNPQADVIELQRLLRQAGFLPANFIVNGIYDATTQAAVREFQRVNGLPVTGTVDAATWNKLYQVTAPKPTPTPTPTPTFNPIPTPTPTPTPPVTDNRQRRVVTDGEPTSVFSGPGTEFDVVRSVPNGAIVTITGRTSGNWSELLEGGWIFTLWLEPM